MLIVLLCSTGTGSMFGMFYLVDAAEGDERQREEEEEVRTVGPSLNAVQTEEEKRGDPEEH